MKAASLNEIKKGLNDLSQKELVELCLRLAKYKKDNKELITYHLFEAGDEAGYIRSIQSLVEEQFEEINTSNAYYIKKGLRKILRGLNKFIKYSQHKTTELDLLTHFTLLMKRSKIPYHRHQVLLNIYNNNLKRIQKIHQALDEDLQFDYNNVIDELKSSR